MGDITKLPKWAQSLISNLEYEIRERDKAIAAYRKDEKPSRIVAEYMSSVQNASVDVSVPDNGLSCVSFYTNSPTTKRGGQVCCSLNVHYPGWLRVDCNSLELRPLATNCILVRPGDRTE